MPPDDLLIFRSDFTLMSHDIQPGTTPVSPGELTITPDRSLTARFLIFMMPVLLDCVLQSASGTIGNIYVGRLLGPGDLAAASSFFPLLLVLVSCGVGLGTGASVLVGQYWGANQTERARVVASAALGVGVGIGILIAAAGQVAIRPTLALFGTPPDILDHATRYAASLLLGTPALALIIISSIVLRGAGDNVRPLVSMAIQIVATLLLTPLAISLGMGLNGAAFAAIGGWCIALIFMALSLRHARHPLAPDVAMLRELLPERAVLLPVLRLGLPAMVEIMTMGFAEIALVGRINVFGSDMTAAYGLFMQTLTYIEYPGMAVGITVSVMCAHAIGARNEAEARAVLRVGFVVGLVVTGCLALAVTLAPGPVASLFTTDRHVTELAAHAFRVVMWSAVPLALGGVIGSAMRASGDVIAPMSILLGCIVLVELPVGYIAAHHYGAWGVWLGYPASFSSIFIVTTVYWAIRWRKRGLVPVI
ncbi:MATE family efflux transporter [Acetobacter oeni]|uniref:MATE family efflux transporter n=1 Tax=Acetobacter oeni TaxID=304077 RepID=A0A511XKK4_9PROT|nr:MATE family efflux transporter [Acetobacter oeni]MBB3881347.1 putative MATE family efflux protein [Acetobacter oeni]NHO18219.1 MATE family efflux transporter [Acetobacter oeni]GBR11275.1 Na+-driven multidrug efflux pump [Acetobacter oeni LMG 21952]GEN63458.1 MATE family efflux transporter [Acetobacter oeni]